MSMAKVVLLGNLGRDPETRYTQSGRMNVYFSMATNTRRTDASGQPQDRTTWFNVTAWGRSAETLDNFAQQGIVRRGTQLLVFGRLESREYQDQNGQTRMALDVTVDDFQLTGSRADSEAQMGGGGGARRDIEDQPNGQGSYESQDIDDIPF